MIKRRKTLSGEIKYLVRVKDKDGKHFPSKTFDDISDAKAFERSLFDDKAKGAKLLPGAKVTLKQYWDQWKDERRVESSKTWKTTQEQLFKDHIEPTLGKEFLTEITPVDISKLQEALQKKPRFQSQRKKLVDVVEKKTLSRSTRLHVHIILNTLFKDAVELYGLLLSSPVRKEHRPKKVKVLRDFLTPDESRKFLKSIVDHQYGVAYWILLGTGLRIGELQALRHGDMDLNRGVIYLKRQWHEKEQIFTDIKNDTPTIIQMPKALVGFIKLKFPEKMPANSLMVTNTVGNISDRKKIYTHLKKALRTLGLKELCIHELRHSMTELWIEMGATVEDIRRQLNQKCVSTTLGYIHRTDDRLVRLASQVNMDEDLSGKVTPIQTGVR
jgi:integrase